MLYVALLVLFALSITLIVLKENVKALSDWDSLIGWGLSGVFVSAVILFFTIVFGIYSYISHIDKLSTLKNQAAVIKIHTDKATQIKAMLDTIPKSDQQNSFTANADSPVVAAAKAMSEAIEAVANAKSVLISAKQNIDARKMGPYSFIVSWMGDGSEYYLNN